MIHLIQLRSENGNVIEEGGVLESSELPDFLDDRYPYLRLVDPYGDTIFSRFQMESVLPELERWAAERPSANIDSVLQLARKCRDEVHTYLWLIGD